MPLLWLESEGKREKEKGVLWMGSVEPWVPAELSSQAGHMAWGNQLGAAAPNVARVMSAPTPACSHQPVLGRQSLLLQWLQLGLLPVGSSCYQHVRNGADFGADSKEQWGCPSADGEALPRQVSWHAEEEAMRTRTKSQVNLWKCFWMTNTKGQGSSWYCSIFWVDSQFELHPSGWWGVWDIQGHAWPC